MKILIALIFAFGAIHPLASNLADAATVRSQEQRAEQIRFSSHALMRMDERGVSREQVLKLVNSVQPFRYFHQGQWKLGYYDSSTGLFVATSGSVVITVFTDATPQYIQRLKRAKP